MACALVAPESVSRPSISAAYEPSAAVCEAVQALEPERERLFRLQSQAGLDAPLAVDLRLSGVGCCSFSLYLTSCHALNLLI